MSNEQESRWRLEFEQSGYEAVKQTVFGTSGWDEPRRQFAFRWLREKEIEGQHRTEQMAQDTRLMQEDTRHVMWLAVAAIVISIIALVVAILK